MESIAVDPGTATRMVKFLNNELHAAQQKIRDLEERSSISRAGTRRLLTEDPDLKNQNDQLKQEVTDLRLRLEVAVEGQDQKTPSNDVLLVQRYEEVRTRLIEVEQQRYEAEQAHAITVQALQEKLSTAREKYQKVKQWKMDHGQSLENMQAQLNEALLVHKANAETKTSQPFDAAAFLEAKEEELPQGTEHPKSGFELPFKKRLAKQAEAALCERAPLHVFDHQIILPADRYDRLLVIVPQFVLHSTPGDPEWRSHNVVYEVSQAVGEKYLEILLRKAREEQWFHCGTYEYVGCTMYAAEEARSLWNQQVEEAIKETVRKPKLIPPVMTNMIPNMYKAGLLSIACFGFKYTGYNRRFREALQQKAEGKGSKGSIAPTVKRKGNASEEAPPRKKAKHMRS